MNNFLIESGPENRGGLPKPKPRFMHVYGGIIYEVYRVGSENREFLRNLAYPFEEQFGYQSRWLIHGKVIHYIKDGSEVVRAVTPRTFFRSARTVGLVSQEVRKVNLEGEVRRVLDAHMRVVVPGFQKRGIGTHFDNDAIVRYDPYAVKGQTRVWRIINMHQGSEFVRGVAPFDMPFTEDMQQKLGAGVKKGAFPPSSNPKKDAGRFIPPQDNQRGVANYQKLKEMGVNPFNGDVIRYVALVNNNAVQVARDKRMFAGELFTYPTESLLSELTRKITGMVASLWKSRINFPK